MSVATAIQEAQRQGRVQSALSIGAKKLLVATAVCNTSRVRHRQDRQARRLGSIPELSQGISLVPATILQYCYSDSHGMHCVATCCYEVTSVKLRPRLHTEGPVFLSRVRSSEDVLGISTSLES